MKFRKIVSLGIFSILAISIANIGVFSSKNAVKTSADAPSNYYSTITADMAGDTLKVALYNIIKGHTKYSYDELEIAMRTTDRNWDLSPDPNDTDPYMVLLYADYNSSNPQKWSKSQGGYGVSSGYTWNKEHIWAKSNGFSSSGAMAYSDLHHLRASDDKLNNTRSNNPFANVSGEAYTNDTFGNKSSCKSSGGVFEPGDQYKGDVARALFYMATRYYNGDGSSGTNLTLTNGTDKSGGKWGYLSTLLEWHELDPVDSFEANRNDLVYQIQGNRNPYIDHPEYARAVFENKPIVEPHKVTDLSLTGTPKYTQYKEGESFNPYGLTVTATYDDGAVEDVTSNVTWSPSPLTAGSSVTVTGTYKEHYVYVNNIEVFAIDYISISGTATKTEYYEGDSFNPAGLTVYAYYTQAMKTDVTSSVVWTPDPLSVGDTSVIATYGSKTATYEGITVKEKLLKSYTIEFKDGKAGTGDLSTSSLYSCLTDDSKKYVSSFTGATKIYEATSGIKMSSSSANGSFTAKLSDSGITNIVGFKIKANKYSDDDNTIKITTNFNSTGKTITTTSTMEEHEVEIEGLLTSFTVTSTKRCYLKSIEVITSGSSSFVSVTDVSLNKSSVTLDLNGSISETLVATVSPSNATNKSLLWTSTNNQVVNVTDGVLTALGVGEANIEVSTVDGGFRDSCAVTVVNSAPEEIPVESVTLSEKTVSLKINETYTLTAVVLPTNATNKDVQWFSEYSSVATVANGILTAKSAGTTHITVRTVDGQFEDICTVYVSSETIVSATGVTLNFQKYKTHVGASFTLEATVQPYNATNKQVTWSSSDESIATVVDGVVTTKKDGVVNINVFTVDGNYTASCIVNVLPNQEAPTSSGGCGGSIVATSIMLSMVSLAGIFIIIKKKKMI